MGFNSAFKGLIILSQIKRAAAIYRNKKQSITFEVNWESVTSSLEKKTLIIRDRDIRRTMIKKLFFVLPLQWMITEVETPLASITEISFFLSENSRGLSVLSFLKPLKQDDQQSTLKCFHFRRPKTRNELKLAKPWVEDNKELKKYFFFWIFIHTTGHSTFPPMI